LVILRSSLIILSVPSKIAMVTTGVFPCIAARVPAKTIN
jgi:hypothetical protein